MPYTIFFSKNRKKCKVHLPHRGDLEFLSCNLKLAKKSQITLEQWLDITKILLIHFMGQTISTVQATFFNHIKWAGFLSGRKLMIVYPIGVQLFTIQNQNILDQLYLNFKVSIYVSMYIRLRPHFLNVKRYVL